MPVDFPLCQHMKTNGVWCGSPALRHKPFCFFHDQWRRHHSKASPGAGFELPLLEDANAIQLALQRVIHAILRGQLDTKTAGLILYALQTASSNLKRTDFEPTDVLFQQAEQEAEDHEQQAADSGADDGDQDEADDDDGSEQAEEEALADNESDDEPVEEQQEEAPDEDEADEAEADDEVSALHLPPAPGPFLPKPGAGKSALVQPPYQPPPAEFSDAELDRMLRALTRMK